MLYNVNIVYDNGQTTNEIIHSVTPISLYPKRDKIKSAVVNVHKYEVEGSFHPGLLQLDDGKKYTVLAKELKSAVDNAMNISRF